MGTRGLVCDSRRTTPWRCCSSTSRAPELSLRLSSLCRKALSTETSCWPTLAVLSVKLSVFKHIHTKVSKVSLGCGERPVLPPIPQQGKLRHCKYPVQSGCCRFPMLSWKAPDGSVSGMRVWMRLQLGEKTSCVEAVAQGQAVEVCVGGQGDPESTEGAVGSGEKR